MYIYIFLSFLFTFFFFLLFSFYPLLFSPYPLEIFFSSHVPFLKKVHRLSFTFFLSRCLEFVSIHQFVSQIDRFFSPFFSLSVSRGLFSLYLPELDFSGFLLDRFYVPNDFSDSSFKIVLPSLSVRIQGISLSIFPVDSSRNRLDFRPLPSPKLSRIPPLATLSLSFVPPLGIFTSSFESLRAL